MVNGQYWPFLLGGLIQVLGMAGFFLWLYYFKRRLPCPDCGLPLPLFLHPHLVTKRMRRAGGYLCENCGCETDAKGAKIDPDSPIPPFPRWRLVAGFGPLVLLTFFLVVVMPYWKRQPPPPPPTAVAPVVLPTPPMPPPNPNP